ncbi:Rps23 Pro-64 3,4-dihydroxylase Tpa1-like proline 4-hydroxylase [Sphingobium wenxiniae]|uniref:Rps23 Pro-64 3,4-dihydroxylase Tpa1-like proline 4-hydroxylase n=1 Tax=Sphingobium wenxiniae (strain DSM 21828 / CGMCC 1.7748 / JZ-1) TaxID=595605 RepID=A0A562KB26_SPHWJ|nr:2OG-Fe(II) oxygenase family protein [Sphingobium wenxiniae]MBB6192127.1 Rps23 Pro-64 3,4-dihydroxylase Tpa1-like proline 4-hydroxylase [Sphingobium wenxiniae]TWH92504.1 Rps23 Pro-64 3,4-dihydroxylase Tpa1-like proline 4-hydroxylase [Sphingobium wenxiniae]
MNISYKINSNLNLEIIKDTYMSAGRVRISDFLDPSFAGALLSALAQRADWMQVINSGDRIFELSRELRRSFDDDRNKNLEEAINNSARYGFQYRYETIRVPDDIGQRNPDDILHFFVNFMNSRPVIEFMREITGDEEVDFVDAQATAYGSGDFLSRHNDAIDGKHRRAAYVLGLTQSWRFEWGGLLMFHEGETASAWLPTFNGLSLFAVPQDHSVSLVTPFADQRRYSVTGWLRSFHKK